MFKLNKTDYFSKKIKKLISKNRQLIKIFEFVFIQMMSDPFHPSLKTHKVVNKFGNKCYSTRVTGDLRVLWDYNEDEIEVLDLLDVGGHTGRNKVYK